MEAMLTVVTETSSEPVPSHGNLHPQTLSLADMRSAT